jgi:hypothetical protein
MNRQEQIVKRPASFEEERILRLGATLECICYFRYVFSRSEVSKCLAEEHLASASTFVAIERLRVATTRTQRTDLTCTAFV